MASHAGMPVAGAPRMDFCIDGYIAYTFSPKNAVQFLTRLLGSNVWTIYLTVFQEGPRAFFIRGPLPTKGRPLDYVISDVGTVVPQRMWSSSQRNSMDVGGLEDGSQSMPIFFVLNHRLTVGLPLGRDITAGGCELENAYDTVLVGGVSTLVVRINVVSFSFNSRASFSCQRSCC
jgi:hypothetical protein